MRVLLVNGSPHIHGTTDAALQLVGNAIRENNIQADTYWIGNKPMTGCIGCGYCSKNGKCHYNDKVNEFLEQAKDYDGFVFGTPVHFSGATGSFTSFMDRVFFVDEFGGRKVFLRKPAGVIAVARRAGTSATIDQINKYPLYAQMMLVGSRYWNMAFGKTPEELQRDEEGVQIMRMLGKNIAWLLESIEAGKEKQIAVPEEEKRIATNFIRQGGAVWEIGL